MLLSKVDRMAMGLPFGCMSWNCSTVKCCKLMILTQANMSIVLSVWFNKFWLSCLLYVIEEVCQAID